MSKNSDVKRLTEPEGRAYPAALSCLSLLYNERTAAAHVNKLKRALLSFP
jgi:hypothetical protein